QGCDIPDIDIVVQYKLCNDLPTFIQRGGRAARKDTHTGLAVLLLEPWVKEKSQGEIEKLLEEGKTKKRKR
ncbi:hypothetical protein BOTBODRAFT_81114, partial [Botryobasidium botryosum FD-172 SS1]